MSLATYSDLKTAALDYMERSDQSSKAADWVTLAEARLNRLLGAVETDASLTGTSGSRSIDISSQSLKEPLALFLAESGVNEIEVQLQPPGSFAYVAASGRPSVWSVNVAGDAITFDRGLDSAYPFRLHFRQRFALSDSATTNWLLTNHPDLYLAATMMWGAGYNEDLPKAQAWKSLLDEGIDEVRAQISRTRRGPSRVDAALGRISRYYVPSSTELTNGEF